MAFMGGHSCVRPWAAGSFWSMTAPVPPSIVTIPFLQTAKPRSLSKGPQIAQGSYGVRSPAQACLWPELALGATLLPTVSRCVGSPQGACSLSLAQSDGARVLPGCPTGREASSLSL